LRENPGGLFRSALGVAELFLPDGVIVNVQSPLREFNRTYRAHNNNPESLRVVVLVDGETASAAEMLAGALKDNGRARVAGKPTFGKGSIQCIIPLEQDLGGLRLTVAKFTSPARVPYSGRGIEPTHRLPDGEDLPDLIKRLNRLGLFERTPMPMPMSP